MGREELGDAHKAYWNVALGLDPAGLAAAGACTLRVRGTATDGPLAGGAIASDQTYPVLAWEVALNPDGGGALGCGRVPLGAAGLAAGYTQPGTDRVCFEHELTVDSTSPDGAVSTHTVGGGALICPAPAAALCADVDLDAGAQGALAAFGEATVDGCGAVEELSANIAVTCGEGSVVRRFRGVDGEGVPNGETCEQVVTVSGGRGDYAIRFPRDADLDVGAGEALPTALDLEATACDLLAVSFDDEFFSASGDECYKTFRTWRVINWCEYDGQSEAAVVTRDVDCDGVPGDEDVWTLVRVGPNGTVTYLDRDGDEANGVPAANTRGSCVLNPAGHWVSSLAEPALASRGYWQYTQQVRAFDATRPTIAVAPVDPFCAGGSCTGELILAAEVTDVGTPNDLTVEAWVDEAADGSYDHVATVALVAPSTYTISRAGLPIGAHRVRVQAEDGCGNVETVEVDVVVADCTAPTPICVNGLVAELMMQGGEVVVFAGDFIVAAPSDCSEPIDYAIRRTGDTPDPTSTSLTLTCADVGSVVVNVDAYDAAGNRDHCETFVLVQDNMGQCP